MKGLMGKKIGMTQMFSENGKVSAVTVIEAGPCVVAQVKTMQTDGYNAIQTGFGNTKEYRLTKPQRGHLGLLSENQEGKPEDQKPKLKPLRRFMEFSISNPQEYTVGQEIKADIFAPGDVVDVQGVTKGRGFTGVMKRWNFRGGPGSHGSMIHRKPMSIGDTNPARVVKGKKMPGHYGAEKVTVQNLKILKVDAEKNLLVIQGAVPGPKGGYVIIKEAIKK